MSTEQESNVIDTLEDSQTGYQSTIQKRINIIRHSCASGLSGTGIIKQMDQSFNIRLSDLYRLNDNNQIRQREKDNLAQLNYNLAKYIQSIRFLEIENRKLIIEIQGIENCIEQ